MKKLIFIAAVLLSALPCIAATKSFSSTIQSHTFRLQAGEDVAQELMSWAKRNQIKAASIVSVVGSLKKMNLRFAGQTTAQARDGQYEIVSMSGTFNDKAVHLHASLVDSKGQTIGGHMMYGNLVSTGVEVVVAELSEVTFARERTDNESEDQLVVQPYRMPAATNQ